LITFLRALGAAPATVARQAGEVDRMLQRYRAYLESERGLASGTLLYYERVARAFLNSIELERRHPDAFSGRSVSAFVLDDCRERNSGSARNVVVALRAFLRFLHVEGLTAVNLAAVVPAVAPHARKLPRSLDPDAVTQLLGSCDRQTVSGRRTFAVLGLLSRLGLRAAEVAAIVVGDIDWRAGELLVRGKGRRRSVMPVPVDVGEALADYLQHARAPIASDRLFVHLKAPAAPITPAAVAGIVRQACRVAGVPSIGPHRLRHAAATQTLRAGASLAEVAQLLRQQTEFTTAIYARVDRAALATVARQWPEVKR
jgi:integrase/recombinase XerD